MNAADQRRDKSAALLVALLLHVPLFLLILSMKHDPVDTIWRLVMDEETLRKFEQEREEWAATRVPGGGAPIVLRDEQPAPQYQQQHMQEPVRDQPEERLVQDKTDDSPVREKADVFPEREELRAATALAQQAQPEPVQKPKQQRQAQPKREPRTEVVPQPQADPQQLTLAQLAQGFISHLRDAHEGEMNMEGTRNGHPSEDQLRRGRYAQKVLQCVIESYHRNRDRAPRMNQPVEICVMVAIGQEGRLASFQFLQPSGIYEIDQFVQQIFQDAGSAFPPLPAAFKQSLFPVRFNVPSIQAFGSTAHWTFG